MGETVLRSPIFNPLLTLSPIHTGRGAAHQWQKGTSTPADARPVSYQSATRFDTGFIGEKGDERIRTLHAVRLVIAQFQLALSPAIKKLVVVVFLQLLSSQLAVSQDASRRATLTAEDKHRLISVLPPKCEPFLSAISDGKENVEYAEAEVSHPSMSTICGARIALAQHRIISLPNATASAVKEVLGVALPEPHIAVGSHTTSGMVDSGTDALQKARVLSLTPDLGFRKNFIRNNMASFATETSKTLSVAIYLDPGSRLHIYEGLRGSTDQAQSVSLAQMKLWTENVRSHSLGPKPRDPLPLGPDPAQVPSTAWTFLFDLTVVWTDGNNTPFTVTLTTYRLNEYDTKDWYLILTEFNDSGAPNFSCPAYNNGWGEGWCGPVMDWRKISFSDDPPLQLLQSQPNNPNPLCTESFSMGDSLSAKIGINSSGSGSVDESTTVTATNGISCGANVVTLTETTSGGSASWEEDFHSGPELLLNQPLDSVLTGSFVSDQAAIYAVDDQAGIKSFSKTFTFSTEMDGGTVFRCGLSSCYTDYIAASTVQFTVQIGAPVFAASPQVFQICTVPANGSTTLNTNITSFIPGPGLSNVGGALSFTYVDPHGTKVYPPGVAAVTPQPPGIGGLDWLPTQLPASNWINTSPAGFTATVPRQWPFFVHSGIPAESPVSFVLTTNPTSAAPSEDFNDDPSPLNTPNGLYISVTTFGAPTVTGVTPSSAPPGQSVQITGTNFMQGSQVFFGMQAGTVQSVSAQPECVSCPPDAIVVLPPPGSGTVPVTVKTNCGTSASFAVPETVAVQPHEGQPTYTFWPDVWPNGAPPGTTYAAAPNSVSMGGGTPVTVRGSGFNRATSVRFGDVGAQITSIDPSGNSLQVLSPRMCGYGTVDVTVTTPVGTSPITYRDQVTVTKTNPIPSSCPGGSVPKFTPLAQCWSVYCYKDLSPSSGLADVVKRLADRNISLHVNPTYFCPSCPISRGEWAAVIAQAFRLPQPSQVVSLADVQRRPETEASYRSIQAATPYEGFVLESDGFRFLPEAPLDRQTAVSSVVSILVNQEALKLEKGSSLKRLRDSNTINPALRPFVATALTKEIFKPVDSQHFEARQPLRRDEAAVFLDRALRLKPK